MPHPVMILGSRAQKFDISFSVRVSVAQLDARPTGYQKVVGLTPAGSATFFRGDLIMKYFLGSFSPLHRFKKGSCQFLAKECAQY